MWRGRQRLRKLALPSLDLSSLFYFIHRIIFVYSEITHFYKCHCSTFTAETQYNALKFEKTAIVART
jgi:hypothetical protein